MPLDDEIDGDDEEVEPAEVSPDTTISDLWDSVYERGLEEDIDAAIGDVLKRATSNVLHEERYKNMTAREFCAQTFEDGEGKFTVDMSNLEEIFFVSFTEGEEPPVSNDALRNISTETSNKVGAATNVLADAAVERLRDFFADVATARGNEEVQAELGSILRTQKFLFAAIGKARSAGVPEQEIRIFALEEMTKLLREKKENQSVVAILLQNAKLATPEQVTYFRALID